jgi:hypothetical protein
MCTHMKSVKENLSFDVITLMPRLFIIQTSLFCNYKFSLFCNHIKLSKDLTSLYRDHVDVVHKPDVAYYVCVIKKDTF